MNNPSTAKKFMLGFSNSSTKGLLTEFGLVDDLVTGVWETTTTLKILKIDFSITYMREIANCKIDFYLPLTLLNLNNYVCV